MPTIFCEARRVRIPSVLIVAVIGLLAATLTPTAAAEPEPEAEFAPSTVVASPLDLPPSGGGATAASGPVAHVDDAQDLNPVLAHEAFEWQMLSTPLWVPEESRAYVLSGPLTVALDEDGHTAAVARIPGISADFGGAIRYADGDLFLIGESSIVRVDPTTLAERDRYPFVAGFFITGVMITTTEILVSMYDGTFERIDRTDGSRTAAGSLPAFVNAGGFRHHESWGTVLLSNGPTGITRYDGSTSPPTVTGSLADEVLIDVVADGSILTRAGDAATVQRRSAVDFSLISATTVGSGPAQIAAAPAGGLVLRHANESQVIEIHREGGGYLGAIPSINPRSTFEPTDDGRRVFISETRPSQLPGGVVWLATTQPFVVGIDHDLYRPSWAPAIEVSGWGLATTANVSIDGRDVPFEIVGAGTDQPSLLIDVSALSTPDGDATLRITSELGAGTFTLPTTVPRGLAPVTVSATGVPLGGSPEGFVVECESETHGGAVASGRTTVVLVPTLERCLARSTTSAGQVRGALGRGTTPASAGADVWGSRVPFFSGRVAHVVFSRDPAPSSNPIWLFTNPVGDPPGDVTYPFDITCGTWSRRYTVPSGFGVRVELPLEVTDTRCTARLGRLRGAERVTSHRIDRTGILRSSDREITFFATQTRGRYLSFVIDHGGADIVRPIAVGAPREDFGSRDNVGVVHVFPTSTDGRLRGGGEQTLRQGRGGFTGAGESHDRFGEVIQAGDFDGDGYLDFAVGVPGEDLGSTKNAGVVNIVFGSARGYRPARTQTISQNLAGVPGSANAADKFGYALAAVDFDGDGYTDLAVGVPGEDVNGVKNAGLVQIFFGSPSGLTTNRVEEISQASAGFHTAPERNDRFGTALAGSGSMLAIGVPREDIRGRTNAGIIHLVDGLTGEQIWDRQGLFTGDRDESKDQFGSVLFMEGTTLGVGVPLEDVGSRTNAGIIHTYRFERAALSQDGELRWDGGTTRTREQTVGVRAGAGDRFGTSLVLTPNEAGTGLSWLVVGAPGARISGQEGAGEVVIRAVLDGQVLNGTFDQNGELPGSVRADAGVGTSLLWGYWGSLITGAPGVPVDGKRGAGRVFTTTDLGDWFGVDQDTKGVGTRSEAAAEFGVEIG